MKFLLPFRFGLMRVITFVVRWPFSSYVESWICYQTAVQSYVFACYDATNGIAFLSFFLYFLRCKMCVFGFRECCLVYWVGWPDWLILCKKKHAAQHLIRKLYSSSICTHSLLILIRLCISHRQKDSSLISFYSFIHHSFIIQFNGAQIIQMHRIFNFPFPSSNRK